MQQRDPLLSDADAVAERRLAENWQAYYEQLDRPRRAWADLLLRHEWHQFWTLTFRAHCESAAGGVHPEAADKAFRFFVSNINRELHGPRWAKKEHGGVVWARGQEFHRSGRIHFHAVAAHPEADLNSLMRRLSWMDFWFKHYGIARIEPPDSQGDVAGYICKYATKGGEVDLSPNFGRKQPPSLFS